MSTYAHASYLENPDIITAIDEVEDEYPSYSDKGFLCVEITNYEGPGKFDVEELMADTGSCVFYIQEGIGYDYYVQEYVDEIDSNGIWMIDNIVGYYSRGDGWSTDDDESFEYETVQKLTQEEYDNHPKLFSELEDE